MDLLSIAFPKATVTGLDFSAPAIAEAQRQYPHSRFLQSPDGSIPETFDCVVTSNYLEHFEDPLAIARRHLASCRDLYIILVPFQEWPRHESHAVTLDHSSFPTELADFKKIHSAAVPTDPKVWPGSQLLTVYASSSYPIGMLPL